MRKLAAIFGSIALVLAAAPVSAAPVLYLDGEPAVIETEEVAEIGTAIESVGDYLVVSGRSGLDGKLATVFSGDGETEIGSIAVDRSIAGGDNTLAAVATAESGLPEVSVYAISPTAVDKTASIEVELVQDIKRFGSELAVSAQYVAVVDTGRGTDVDQVLVFAIDGGELNEILRVQPSLTNVKLALAGDKLLVSGSAYLANNGSLLMYDVATGEELDRVDSIGGGEIVVGADNSEVFVQRNQYFADVSDTWALLGLIQDSFSDPVHIPAKASSLTVADGVLVMGDAAGQYVLVFQRTQDEEAWPFTFVQALRPPEGAALFGRAVATTSEGTILVGAPNSTVDEQANRGAVFQFAFADGPIGCSVVGTPGDEEKLVGTSNRDTICGLGGDDRILGFAGDDVIYGGPGNDRLQGDGGDDVIYGGDGDDTLNGSGGNDTMFGEVGNDIGNGGAGNDQFIGGPGSDRGNGGAGADSCEAEQAFSC